MATWYRAGGFSFDAPIEAVEVERETESSVWVNGRRRTKRNGWSSYFRTWEEAHSFLLNRARERLESAQRELAAAAAEVEKIAALKRERTR